MPCGGIRPTTYRGGIPSGECFVCPKIVLEGEGLFVEEWDAVIHRDCLMTFLSSEEGMIVIKHGHEIYVPEKGS